MVGGGVDRDVPASEARGRERHAEAPEVVALPLRIEDRSRRGEDALQPPRLDRQQAAEGELAGLQRGEIVLARDGNLGEVVERNHVLGPDRCLVRPDARLVEDAPDVLSASVRPRHGLAQPRPQVGPPGGGILLL